MKTMKALVTSDISPEALAELVNLTTSGKVTSAAGKEVFAEMLKTGKSPSEVVKEKGLLQVSDESELRKTVEEVLAENPKPVEDFNKGKKNAFSFLMGRVMSRTRGKANPAIASRILSELLGGTSSAEK